MAESEQSSPVSAFLRAFEDEILREWIAAARQIEPARDLSLKDLLDSLPDLLRRIGDMADALMRGRIPPEPKREADEHAGERLVEGFDVAQVVAEYVALRDCVTRVWDREQKADGNSLRVLNQAIDRAIATSVERYTEARDRSLRALDAVAVAALESSDLDDLLHRLLEVVVDTIPAVDTAAMLLRIGDELEARASVGIGAEYAASHFRLKIGDGFAGRVAAERRPIELRSGADDPLVRNTILKIAGIKALYGVPLIEGGEVLGVAHIGALRAHSFSEQDKRLFETMASRASTAVLHHMLHEETRRAVRARDEVLAVVSHDLRNQVSPLVFSAMRIEQLAADEKHREIRRAAEVIHRSATRMTRLIEDLLDFGAIERRALTLERKPTDPTSIPQEAVEHHAALASERGIELGTVVGPDLRPICADRSRLLQVLDNLLMNAVNVQTRGGSITIAVEATKAGARFRVTDKGPGIPTAHLEKIFDRYWRCDEPLYRGSGLGLSIARGIVDAHGGRIWAESTPGQGATFKFEIPWAEREE